MERNQKLKPFSQENRKNMTREEGILWRMYLSAYPIRFRRQYILGNYIADFYCHKAKLVIELDGSQHYEEEGMRKDAIRTNQLEKMGVSVLRFSNADINFRLREVCDAIDIAVNSRIQDSPSE